MHVQIFRIILTFIPIFSPSTGVSLAHLFILAIYCITSFFLHWHSSSMNLKWLPVFRLCVLCASYPLLCHVLCWTFEHSLCNCFFRWNLDFYDGSGGVQRDLHLNDHEQRWIHHRVPNLTPQLSLSICCFEFGRIAHHINIIAHNVGDLDWNTLRCMPDNFALLGLSSTPSGEAHSLQSFWWRSVG